MTAHTQPELRRETETGLTEAKVGRIICVVVSIVAVCAGSFIVTAEPSRPRVAPAIHGAASTKMAIVVPHLSNGERSFAVTWHKTVAKSAGFGVLHQDVDTPRAVVAAAGRRADAVGRIAQNRTVVDLAD